MTNQNQTPAPVPAGATPRVAYFCMEYGLSELLPIYSGGLGILAGDFIKSAGDLKLPVVGVGLRWGAGTTQHINAEGQAYDEWPPYTPRDMEDTGVRVRVRVRSREVECMVWKVTHQVTVPLYLIEPVHAEDKWITERLYDTRHDCRIAQEMLLGIGGVRALPRLGHTIDIYHFNEGHAVFAGLELIAERMSDNKPFAEAWKYARERIVFTTHTPVPAGNEVHSLNDIRRMGAGMELLDNELRQLGGDPFNMTVAGLHLAKMANAVSELHGEVSRKMWKDVHDASPILSITNGVHQGTWQAPGIRTHRDAPVKLWETHATLRGELRGMVKELTGVELDPDALTIGFARRAASYKRADLILRDQARLERLLAEKRVQILFSGKAHAADGAGKKIIATLVDFARKHPTSVLFLENYEMGIARRLVRGADIWLNNPERPLEASGTSGMKAALNGVLNMSILDGWWPEGCVHGETGWAIGNGDEGGDHDARDAESLYNTLENEVLPAWGNREKWVRMMQASIRMAEEKFTSERMVRDYYEKLYRPALA